MVGEPGGGFGGRFFVSRVYWRVVQQPHYSGTLTRSAGTLKSAINNVVLYCCRSAGGCKYSRKDGPLVCMHRFDATCGTGKFQVLRYRWSSPVFAVQAVLFSMRVARGTRWGLPRTTRGRYEKGPYCSKWENFPG
ncbi:unnamed protein product, partial [Pylaiella littoralis]